MRRQLVLGIAVCLSVLVLAGCSGGGSDSIYTYNQKAAGNIAASDSLGASLSQHNGVQTAFVPDEN